MAKKKKKTPPKPSRELKSKAFFNERLAAVRRMFLAYGLDPALLERFNKKQMQFLLHATADQPKFKAKEGHRVSRRLLDFVSESTHRFMRQHTFGDEKFGFTYIDMATHGLAFACAVMLESWEPTFPPEQSEIIKELAKTFGDNRLSRDLDEVTVYIHHLSMMISKMNFRVYGFGWRSDVVRYERHFRITNPILMSSEDVESVRVLHNGKERPAFRVMTGQVVMSPGEKATIKRSLVTTEGGDPDDLLEIYIQSHALQRAKERVDVLPAHKRNYYITIALMYIQHVVDGPGRRKMLTCCDSILIDGKETPVVFGYFPFIIEGDKLIITTCLPLTAPETWSGKALRERLRLQTEDMKYLGMDKLSFYLTVDFEQVPALKEVIEQTEIRRLLDYPSHNSDFLEFLPHLKSLRDKGATNRAKRFFEGRQ
jgi:hypothetical protein